MSNSSQEKGGTREKGLSPPFMHTSGKLEPMLLVLWFGRLLQNSSYNVAVIATSANIVTVLGGGTMKRC